MLSAGRVKLLLVLVAAALAAFALTDAAPNSQPNPYRTGENWGTLPEGQDVGIHERNRHRF
jgi:hypothetical protein